MKVGDVVSPGRFRSVRMNRVAADLRGWLGWKLMCFGMYLMQYGRV